MTYDKTPLEKDGITVMVGGQQDGHWGPAPAPPLNISSLGAVKHPDTQLSIALRQEQGWEPS